MRGQREDGTPAARGLVRWDAVARGRVRVERGGAGRREGGTPWRGVTREWSVGCSWNAWFTRAQARAYAACGGLGRKRPWVVRGAGTQCAGSVRMAHRWRGAARMGRGGAGPREVGRGGAGPRESGTRWRGATRGWNAVARGNARMERWLQLERLVHPCSSTGLCRLRRFGA
jgi:hypothetical protein